METSYLTQTDSGAVVLHLHIQPKASKTKIVGLYDGCLKIAVKAPPVEGKANQELVRFLASLFKIATRDVTVKSGTLSRRKQIVITSTKGTTDIMAIIDTALNP